MEILKSGSNDEQRMLAQGWKAYIRTNNLFPEVECRNTKKATTDKVANHYSI